MFKSIYDQIQLPEEWHSVMQIETDSGVVDDELKRRIHQAGQHLAQTTFNENIELAHRCLRRLGLIPLASTSTSTSTSTSSSSSASDLNSNAQVHQARTIIRLIMTGGVLFKVGDGHLEVPRCELLFMAAAMHFNVELFVFSTSRRPHIYRPSAPRSTVGIFWARNSYSSASDICPLVCTRTAPQVSQPVLNPPPVPRYPAAELREVLPGRPRAQPHHQAPANDNAFILAWYENFAEE